MNTLRSELADWFKLASEKKPIGDVQSPWEKVSLIIGEWSMKPIGALDLDWTWWCACREGISASAPRYRKIYHRTKPNPLRVAYLWGIILAPLHWVTLGNMLATCTEDILRDNCSELDFYIYCRNVAEDILYDMVFPLRGAMREFFWAYDLFLSYGHCDCYNIVSLFALIARKPRAMVQISSSNCTRLFDKHFTY